MNEINIRVDTVEMSISELEESNQKYNQKAAWIDIEWKI